MEKLPYLRNWSINPLNPGRHGLVSVRGDVYNDSRFDDGTTIITSEVKNVDFKCLLLYTKNTVYRLEI